MGFEQSSSPSCCDGSQAMQRPHSSRTVERAHAVAWEHRTVLHLQCLCVTLRGQCCLQDAAVLMAVSR